MVRLLKWGDKDAGESAKERLSLIFNENKKRNTEKKRNKALRKGFRDGFCPNCRMTLFAHERTCHNCDRDPSQLMRRQLSMKLGTT